MMMRTISVLSLLFVSASATPALVWKKSSEQSVVHNTDTITAESLLTDVLRDEPTDASLAAVVFLLGRGENGTENLSVLASQGALPHVSSKQISAHSVHHYVSGVSTGSVVVNLATRSGHSPFLVNLNEFHNKLSSLEEVAEVEVNGNGFMSKSEKVASKRSKLLAKANVLVVSIPSSTDPSEIDAAVVKALDNKSVKNVILSAHRSTDEVKHERVQLSRRRLEIMHETGSRMVNSRQRRLEEAQGDNANNANNDNADLSGVYYVNLTPNILAGLLFFFLFTTITYIGVSCMNMISGQDVFVSKMPAVGREA